MRIINKYIGVLLTTVILSGCEKFLDVGSPKDQLNQQKAFNDDRTATAALTSVYTSMSQNGFLSGAPGGGGALFACFTDEIEITSLTMDDGRYFYEGGVASTNNGVLSLWKNAYNQIYIVNNVLDGLKEKTGVTGTVRSQLLGEALAVRGLLHFYLCQTFGKVPVIKSTDYNFNKSVSKSSVDTVMTSVLTDLEEAEKLLSDNYPTAQRVRINKAAVQAIKARVLLYMKKWTEALQAAQSVIDRPAYVLENLESVYLTGSRSAIWQFAPQSLNKNAQEAYTYIFSELPAKWGRLSPYLLQNFEANDQRKTEWTKSVITEDNRHANKYKVLGFTTPPREYASILRIQEMYLIAAEAAAHLEDWDTCNDRLNAIRSKAGLTSIEVDNLPDAVDAVVQERRAEFFCEYGHRYYDLKRLNRLDDLLVAKPNWQAHFNLLPIPENELLLNSKLLPQNTGY